MKTFTDFNLHLYTDIVYGKDKEKMAGELVKKHGGKKVMLVYGGGSIKKMGLYDTVVSSLKDAGLEIVELPGVQPNPRRSLVQKGIELAKAEGVDFLLAVGGGSTLDTAKAIACAVKFGDNWWDMFSKGAVCTDRLGVGSIHTISAAGSESSTSMVVVDDVERIGQKCSNPSACLRPDFAIMNPELTYSVSKYQTASGAADIFAHTLERYFYNSDCALGDEFAAGLLRTVVKYGPIACEDPNNYEARGELMLCATFSHNDITGIGHSGVRGGPHGLESIISGTYDTAHGAGLAVVMPAWLRYVADFSDKGCARVAKLAIEVFGVTPDLADLKSVAYEGIERFKSWLKRIGMPLTLTELGVENADIDLFIERGRFNADGLFVGYVTMTKDQMRNFYEGIL